MSEEKNENKSEDLKSALEAQATSVKELRDAAEKGIKLTDEKIKALKDDFTKGEEASKAITAKLEAQEKEMTASKDAMDLLEKKLNRLPSGTDDSEKKAIITAFENYIKYPNTGEVFTAQEQDLKYLRTDLAADGGVLVPDILSSELLKEEVEVSPILANATVKTADVKSMETAIRTTIPSVNRPGEGGTSTVSNSNFKKFRLEAYRNDVVIPITREELKWAAFNMRSEMTQDAALALTYQTNVDFLTGDGVSKSEGILTSSEISNLNSGVANDITMDNFLEIQKKDNIKGVYRRNGKFYMNANTIFDLAQRKDGQGQYLWQQNIASTLPNQIAGKPYVDTPDMPDIGAGLLPVMFGDLKKGYYILRASGVELIIDIYSSKKQGIIEYMWVEFIGGKVALGEAMVTLTCST